MSTKSLQEKIVKAREALEKLYHLDMTENRLNIIRSYFPQLRSIGQKKVFLDIRNYAFNSSHHMKSNDGVNFVNRFISDYILDLPVRA